MFQRTHTIVLATFLLLSCSREIPAPSPKSIPMREYSFGAGVESGKTVLDNLSVNWQSSDCVYVFYRGGFSEATLTSFEGSRANFVVMLPETVALDTLFAVYRPAESGGSPFVRLDDTSALTQAAVGYCAAQKAVLGSFDSVSAPMVARWVNGGSDSPYFVFRNLSSLLKLSLENRSNVELDSIVFRSSKDFASSCNWGFAPGSDEPVLSESEMSGHSMRLEGPFENKGEYYFAIPPSPEPYDGISLSFHSSAGVKTFRATASLTAERNTICSIGSYEITDEWFSPDTAFEVSCASTRRFDRDTTYYVVVSAGPSIAWTAEVDGLGTSLSPSSGTGWGLVKVSVPANCSFAEDRSYTVRVSTPDSRVPEDRRLGEVVLTQAHETKVLFGTTWGNSLLSSWNAAGFTADVEYTGEFVTVKTSGSLGNVGKGSCYIKGKYSFSFVSGETGKGTITFKARKNGTDSKKIIVKKGNETVFSYNEAGDHTNTFSPSFEVVAGDVITLTYSSGSDNYMLYCGADNPISWSGVPEIPFRLVGVGCSIDAAGCSLYPVLRGWLEYEGQAAEGMPVGFDYLRLAASGTKSSAEGWGAGPSAELLSDQDYVWTSVEASLSDNSLFSAAVEFEAARTYLVRAWAQDGSGGRKYSDAVVYSTAKK